jgi:hypothetical protein
MTFLAGQANYGALMGYRIRILGTKLISAPLQELQQAAEPGVLEGDEGKGDDWEALILRHMSGEPIAFIEKNLVIPGQLGAKELQEFIDEVGYYKPTSAATWLYEYLPTVKVIYAFQLLNGTDIDDGFAIMHRVYGIVWHSARGILQADGEGFSNEDGYTILWQFSDHVSGEWKAGVLTSDGSWINFKIDLGNQIHRDAFWQGQVPTGVEIISSDSRE